MIKNGSIFTNLEEFEEVVDETEVEVEVEFEQITLPDYENIVGNSKLEKLVDMVASNKPKTIYDVLPDMNVSTEVPSFNQPTNLEHLDNCPRCNTPMKMAIAINGSDSMSFKECIACGTLVNTFKPISYQAQYMERRELYTAMFGGFGSGKSRVNIEQVIKHLILIPNARVVVAAKTYPALEATFVKDFFSIMPKRLLRKKNEMKHEWVFTNGSELLLRSFDDETKLRGINATMFVLLEASNIQYAGFELAQNRIRNTAALIPKLDSKGNIVKKYDERSKLMRIEYEFDARKILIESNPDSGWIKKKFLLDSHEVSYYGSAHREGYRMNTELDPNKYSVVMATDANPHLPENFIQEQTRGKSTAYIKQFFYGSFNFSENTVYPNVGARIVAPHPLPPTHDEQGRRALFYMVGLDYGVNDPLAIIYAAYSTITRKLYFFDEVYERGLDVKTAVARHRAKMKQHRITNDQLLMLPVFDGRSHNKRESNLQTIGSLFNAQGLYFKPSFTYNDARIAKFNGIINAEQIEIYSNSEFYIEEVVNYKYKINRDGTPSSNPEDKNNHGINAGEFIIMELPLNLEHLNVNSYLPAGTYVNHDIYENKPKEEAKPFNPYEGGNEHGRNATRNTNNPYGRTYRPKSVYTIQKPTEEQGDLEGNLFQAFVPRRSK